MVADGQWLHALLPIPKIAVGTAGTVLVLL